MAKILVVEDNLELLTILKELLTTRHEVHTAQRGEDGVQQAREVRPDLVIMDLQLPSMSGVEAGRSIKDDVGDIPIIALTALAQSEDQEAVLRSGCCDAYITKPASLADIERTIAELLQNDGSARHGAGDSD